MFRLTTDPLSTQDEMGAMVNEKAGAALAFEGWVRNHNQGQAVSSLEYQVYEALALKEGVKIVEEAKEKFNIFDASCIHRYGHLKIGEISILIIVNSAHRHDSYLASRFIIDEVKKRLPVWKKENYVTGEAKWVFCRDHQHHVHFEEADYYTKQAPLVNQKRLSEKKVLVIGAGGLGCGVLTALANAGVGEIKIVDHDSIHISNMHRQFLYSPNLVGEKKAEAAASRIAEMNPFIKVEGLAQFFSVENGAALVGGADLVLDCTDNLSSKELIHDFCFSMSKPVVTASVYKYEGVLKTYIPGGPWACMKCYSKAKPQDEALGNCNDYGVLGASVQSVGALQALEAIKLLNDGRNATDSHTLLIDMMTMTQTKLVNPEKASCPSCNGELLVDGSFELDADDLRELDHRLVDVRLHSEEDLQGYLKEDSTVVLYCTRGHKSLQMTKRLREKGYDEVYSLRGGECSL